MNNTQSLAHTRWDCKYHVVWIPNYRRKKLFGEIRRELGPMLRELAQRKESEIVEGTLLVDHIHRLIAMPPK
jgi:putative transposase